MAAPGGEAPAPAAAALGVVRAWLAAAERGESAATVAARAVAASAAASALEGNDDGATEAAVLAEAPALLQRAAALPAGAAAPRAHAALLAPYLGAFARARERESAPPAAAALEAAELFLASAFVIEPAAAVELLADAGARSVLRRAAPAAPPRAAMPLLRALAAAPAALGARGAAAAVAACASEATAAPMLRAAIDMPLWTAALVGSGASTAPNDLKRFAEGVRSGSAWGKPAPAVALAAAEGMLAPAAAASRPALGAAVAAACGLGPAVAQALLAACAREAPVGTLEELVVACMEMHAAPLPSASAGAECDYGARCRLVLREGLVAMVRSEPAVLERRAAWQALALAVTSEAASAVPAAEAAEATLLAAALASALAVAPATVAEDAFEALELALYQCLPTRGRQMASEAAAGACARSCTPVSRACLRACLCAWAPRTSVRAGMAASNGTSSCVRRDVVVHSPGRPRALC